MKYFLGQRPVLDWTGKEKELIDAAVAFAQCPPDKDVFLEAAKFVNRATGVEYVIIGKLVGKENNLISTLAYTQNQEVLPNITYSTIHTPCESVLGHNFCFYPENVQERFPSDQDLVKLGIQSYMGLPLNDREDNTIGLFTLLHTQPIVNPEFAEHLLFIMAATLEEHLTQASQYPASLAH